MALNTTNGMHMDKQHTPEPLIKTIDGNAYVKYGYYRALQQRHADLLAALKEAASYTRHTDYDWDVAFSREVSDIIANAGDKI